MKRAAKLTGLIHPTVADYESRDLEPTLLPFVKDKGKGKKKRRSYWEVKPTGNYALDTVIGRTCAIELLQYMMMKPGATWCFQAVMEAVSKKGKNGPIRWAFMSTISELAVVGANANAKGIQVDTSVEEEVKR